MPPRSSSWFRRRLAAVAGLALLGRVLYGLMATPSQLPFSDALVYHLQANALADGYFFILPCDEACNLAARGQSAVHPPLFTALLAVASFFGGSSVDAHRVFTCFLGAATVVAVGLCGRRVLGDRGGLLAAILAAAHPALWINDGLVVAETAYALTLAVVLLLAYRFHDAPGRWNAILLGLAIGVAGLARAEAFALVLVVVVPLAVGARRFGWGERLRLIGLACLAGVLLVAPWVARNLTSFDRPVLVTTTLDFAIGAANCPEAYEGPRKGLLIGCRPLIDGDESEKGYHQRQRGLRYAANHLDQLPGVVATRVARAWSLYRPFPAEGLDLEGRPSWAYRAAAIGHWVMLPFALAGIVVLRRRRVPVSPLVVQFAVVSVAVAVTWGSTRFRIAADVAIVLLAAAAVDALVERWRTRWRPTGPETSPGAEEAMAPRAATPETRTSPSARAGGGVLRRLQQVGPDPPPARRSARAGATSRSAASSGVVVGAEGLEPPTPCSTGPPPGRGRRAVG